MWTLLFALLCAVILHTSWEGTVKARGVLAACTFVRLGRLRLALWCYRPERVYVKLGRV